MPPLAFLVLLGAVGTLSLLFSAMAFRVQKKTHGELEAYACGEESDGAQIQPDYSQFFPFAFFFTILHVAALIIATVPVGTIAAYTMAVVYIIGAVTGLVVLFRK